MKKMNRDEIIKNLSNQDLGRFGDDLDTLASEYGCEVSSLLDFKRYGWSVYVLARDLIEFYPARYCD